MARFLIIDDDPSCRLLLKHYLEPYGDCDQAYDGHEALAAFRMALEGGRPYDLVCLDIMMPGADGHQVLANIRRLEQEHGILGGDGVKVVMITALMNPKHCIQAFEEGCESYVTKPVCEDSVLAQVRSLLGDLDSLREKGRTPPRDSSRRAACRPCPTARYLIVDDDRVCRELLKEMLSPYGRCDFAYNGAEAADAVRLAIEDGLPYDLICLDIMMPGTSGHDALAAIRRIEAEHGIQGSDGVKVIMTTALRNSRHCIQAFREGCESYVTKPIREGELLERMRDLGLLNAVKSFECEL